MDVFLSKLMHLLAFAAVGLIATAYFGLVLLILWSFRGHMPKTTLGRLGMILVFLMFGPIGLLIMRAFRGPMPEAKMEKTVGIWVFLVALPILLLTFSTLILLHFSVWHRFNTIMMQKPNRLLISSEGKTNEITDAVVIGEFFKIATRSRKVMAHHSHTVSEVRLFFPQTGYTYSLRRDSHYTNEYWLDWVGVSGRERDRLAIGDNLGQLRSDELERWVRRYAPETALQKQNAHAH